MIVKTRNIKVRIPDNIVAILTLFVIGSNVGLFLAFKYASNENEVTTKRYKNKINVTRLTITVMKHEDNIFYSR